MAADPNDTSAKESATATTDGAVENNGADTAVAESTKESSPTVSTVRLKPAELIREFETAQLKTDLPEIYVGDTVRVGVRISEGNKERVQPYEGVVYFSHGCLALFISSKRTSTANHRNYLMIHHPANGLCRSHLFLSTHLHCVRFA